MNREIKFRGKTYNGKWIYGYCYKVKSLFDQQFNWFIRNEYQTDNMIIPETLGQYTGLKDKNGVEAYEGDKVMFDYEWTKSDEIGVITWNKNTASFQIKGHIPSSSMKHLDRMKVIGNIYEDKEVS